MYSSSVTHARVIIPVLNYEIIDPSYMYAIQAAKILPLQYIEMGSYEWR